MLHIEKGAALKYPQPTDAGPQQGARVQRHRGARDTRRQVIISPDTPAAQLGQTAHGRDELREQIAAIKANYKGA